MSASLGFRASMLGDWRWRLADVMLHVSAALLLPWWWLQYVPDAALLPLWLRGMLSDRFDRGTRLLATHQMLHLRGPQALVGLTLYVSAFALTGNYWIMVHVAVHVGIDRLTHDGRWQ